MFKGIIASIFGATGNSTTDDTNALSRIINTHSTITMHGNSFSSPITVTQMSQQQNLSAHLAQQQAALGQLQQPIYINGSSLYTFSRDDKEFKDYLKLGIDLMSLTINFKILAENININSDILPSTAIEIFKELLEHKNIMWFNKITQATHASKIMFDNNIPAMIIHKTLTIRMQPFTIAGLQVQTKDDMITLKMCL